MMNARINEVQTAEAAGGNQDGLLAHLRRQLRRAEAAAAHAPVKERTAHRARADRLTRTIFRVHAQADQVASL
jgi:hypothetical protein